MKIEPHIAPEPQSLSEEERAERVREWFGHALYRIAARAARRSDTFAEEDPDEARAAAATRDVSALVIAAQRIKEMISRPDGKPVHGGNLTEAGVERLLDITDADIDAFIDSRRGTGAERAAHPRPLSASGPAPVDEGDRA